MPAPFYSGHFDVQDELIYNICHPASGVRAVAYACLVRLLRHAPTRWPAVLPGYMAALEVHHGPNIYKDTKP